MSALFADGSLAKTIEDAAPLVGCTESLLRDAITARRIPHRRLGTARGIVLTREDLEAFLESCLVEPQYTATVTPMALASTPRRRTAAA